MANLKVLGANINQEMSPNYTFILSFEETFKHEYAKEWFSLKWHTSLYAIAIYLVVIFGGKALMSNRDAFKLRTFLTMWNLSLALFSIIGFLRTAPELFHVLTNFGFYHSVCTTPMVELAKPYTFWTFLFAWSKIPELGDTIFIVLRKQKLIFLHWYHHVTVLVFTWYVYSEYAAITRWFVAMNYFVHSLMYSYYALRAIGYRMPRNFAMLITIAQIAQMIMGTIVSRYAYYRKSLGHRCELTQTTAYFALFIYTSYLILFAHFFYKAYFGTNNKNQDNGLQTAQDRNVIRSKQD